MTRNATQEFFRTADLALCGALCVLGFVVDEVDRVEARRSVFIFKNSIELEAAVSGYWRGELRVEPQAYFNQLKVLKARIYER